MSNIKSFKENWERTSDLAPGGQGTTILCSNIQHKELTAAIKTLNRQQEMERRARMHRECITLSTLSHPGLPKLIDGNTYFWKDKSYNLFIATEFIEGPTLAQFEAFRLSFSDKIALTINISEIIKYCHERGIIHRDIKPDNIILRKGLINEPIVIDFGISFNFNDNDDDYLTPSGQQLGNRFLILPEQKVGEISKRDIRSDISCLVGLLYYFVTNDLPTIIIDEQNRKPHQRDNARQIIDALPQHQKDLLNNIFDIGFNQLIDRRWQTVVSFIDQLNLLQNAEPKQMEKIENIIKELRNQAEKQEYLETKEAKELFKKLDITIRQVVDELIKELGEDWSCEQTGKTLGSKNKDGFMEYDMVYSMINMVDNNLRTTTQIYGFITGNELVIQLKERGETNEAFRQPILNKLDWNQLRENLKEHYLQHLFRSK